MNDVDKIKSFISSVLLGTAITKSDWNHPRGADFEFNGRYESLGKAMQQLSPEAPIEANLQIFSKLKEEFSQKPGQLELLRMIEASIANIPFEFGSTGNIEDYPTLRDIFHILGETKYAWMNYIMYGGITAIAGDVGAGKTLFAMDLHRRQFLGLPWPDGTAIDSPGKKVVWLMADQRLGQLVDISRQMSLPDDSIVLASEFQKPTIPLTLDNSSALTRLNQIVRDIKPWAVFIDTFTSAMGAKEQHKPETINPVTTSLLEIAQANQIAVILLCHTNADGGIYGKALSRKCEHQLAITLSDRHSHASPRNLHCKRSRRFEHARSFGITFQEGHFEYGDPHEEIEDGFRHKNDRRDSKAETDISGVALILTKAGASGITLSEATTALQSIGRDKDAAQKAAQRALDSLRSRGKVSNRDRRWYLEQDSEQGFAG